jgi:hypothetical protein
MDGSRRSVCLENTRVDILTLVIRWASDPTSTQRVLWLHGPAGSGKSTISTTLADRFRHSQQLGAFLFFDRDVTERSNPAKVAPTLAYQLSSFYPDIGDLITAAIDNTPQTLILSTHSQFQDLLVDPLSGIESSPAKSQIVLIIDALDECGTVHDRSALVNALAEQSAHFPSTFRFVITSRPDRDIRLAFESQPHVLTLELDLLSTAAKEDILAYFRHHMNIIRKKNKYLNGDWPGKKKINALARRASGLFVWASIACNFIDAHDPRKRLSIILKEDTASTAEVALDALYRTSLAFAGAWDDKDFVADFRAITGMILFLRNPLTSTAIDNLLANPDGLPSSKTIEQLNCLLSSKPAVRLIHPSLKDFLTNQSRCGRDIWYFTPAPHERTLAILCLRRLQQLLHQDMSQMLLLVDQDDQAIPQDMAYACVFWVDHICLIKDDLPPIEKLLTTFINQHILHWFEAMSLLKRFSLTTILLHQLSEWIQCHFPPSRKSLVGLIHHWWRFSQEYEAFIQENPMQVYSKALLREFQIIEVQEPLDSHPPTLSIFDLPLPLSQSSVDFSSPQQYSNYPISRPVSPSVLDSIDSAPPALPPASPDLARFSRRLSRSSLSLPSSRNSSMSRSASRQRYSLASTPPASCSASRPASPHRGPQSSLNLLPRRNSLSSPVSLQKSTQIYDTGPDFEAPPHTHITPPHQKQGSLHDLKCHQIPHARQPQSDHIRSFGAKSLLSDTSSFGTFPPKRSLDISRVQSVENVPFGIGLEPTVDVFGHGALSDDLCKSSSTPCNSFI